MFSIADNKEEHELENENELSKLSEMNVIEFYNSPNKKKKNNNCYKIALFVAYLFHL